MQALPRLQRCCRAATRDAAACCLPCLLTWLCELQASSGRLWGLLWLGWPRPGPPSSRSLSLCSCPTWWTRAASAWPPIMLSTCTRPAPAPACASGVPGPSSLGGKAVLFALQLAHLWWVVQISPQSGRHPAQMLLHLPVPMQF